MRSTQRMFPAGRPTCPTASGLDQVAVGVAALDDRHPRVLPRGLQQGADRNERVMEEARLAAFKLRNWVSPGGLPGRREKDEPSSLFSPALNACSICVLVEFLTSRQRHHSDWRSLLVLPSGTRKA